MVVSSGSGQPAVVGVARIDFRRYEATRKGKPARMTPREFAVLHFLLGRCGEVVSRDELLNEVWGYNSAVTTHTLETHIYRLRQKIEPEPGQARLLLTDAGGYRLQP